MDEAVEKIAALGVPGLVLIGVMSSTGLAGAAAFTSALAILGGPFGMFAGVATMGVLILISQTIAKFGAEKVGEAVVNELKAKGKTNAEILYEINKFPISKDLKLKLRYLVLSQ
ncbi:MAG: hypothetical protein HXX20_22780 [Chloroflexi bacterium]|nr:hypothetical protein [Chloroflexota bacterium]